MKSILSALAIADRANILSNKIKTFPAPPAKVPFETIFYHLNPVPVSA
ncbi:hypothetical protein [Pseudoalteromonas sp. PA2MD11]|nr:hypothetical protein [Pseudoalteromonas sp. PA2MD11]